MTDTTAITLGKIFFKSNLFPDIEKPEQAIVKILAGQELGISPVAAMRGIDIIKGKLALSAALMATILKRHGGYDYRIIGNTNNKVSIEFFFEKESLGISNFSIDDAKQAGLLGRMGMYKKFPRNMLIARAMSNGIQWYCPEVLGGPAYTPSELDIQIELPDKEENKFTDEEMNKIKQEAIALNLPAPLVFNQLVSKYPDLTLEQVKEWLPAHL